MLGTCELRMTNITLSQWLQYPSRITVGVNADNARIRNAEKPQCWYATLKRVVMREWINYYSYYSWSRGSKSHQSQ